MDIGELAATGATTLVAAMTTGAWEQIRTRLARLLGRRDDDAQRELESDLDEARKLLVGSTGEELTALEIKAELRGRLSQFLRSNPDLAAELESLLAEVQSGVPDDVTPVGQYAFADRGAVVIQAGRDVRGTSLGADRDREK
ncbi:hypothetical protein OG474_13495 [Kribbella sp. NBC_01505]|uniref:hypothetical protein n=1 Tax=Kribbella sp. NBC_01505 TaxID=2903580 RepID=UPI00386B7F8C